jgi:hypothetical protein
MLSEVDTIRRRYAKAIEDGRRIEVFTSMPEWQWYVEHVINPTIADYTERILAGKLPTDKEDWITRGMIMGLKMVVDTTTGFKETAKEARVKAADLEKRIKAEEDIDGTGE